MACALSPLCLCVSAQLGALAAPAWWCWEQCCSTAHALLLPCQHSLMYGWLWLVPMEMAAEK